MTSGSVNAFVCTFDFSEEWDGLNKFAVFKTNQIEPIRIFLGDKTSCFVPWEMFIAAGETIRVGAYGMHGMPEDADSYIVMPTTWLTLGVVDEGVIFGKEPEEPTPDILEQILETKGDTLDYRENTLYLKAGDKVLSSVEIASGGGSTPGADGTTFIPHISDDGTLTWTNDGGLPNPNPVNLMGPEGKDGKEYLVINTSFYNPPQVGVIYSLDLSDFNRMPTIGEQTSGVITVDTVTYYVAGIIPSINIIDGVSHPDAKITKVTKLTGEPGASADLNVGDGLSKVNDTIFINNPVKGIMSISDYNSLTDEEKSTGTYFVDDGSSDSPGEGRTEVYQDEEILIGSFFGKPLYRKCFYMGGINVSNGGYTIANVEFLNVDTLVDIKVLYYAEEGQGIRYRVASDCNTVAGLTEGKKNVKWYSSSIGNIKVYYVILEYTKTTDSEVTI